MNYSQTKIKPEDVIQFRIQKSTEYQLKILFEAQQGFKIYEKNLKFVYKSPGVFPHKIKFKSSPKSQEVFDTLTKKKEKMFLSSTEFTFSVPLKGELEIEYQACADGICLMPAKRSLVLNKVITQETKPLRIPQNKVTDFLQKEVQIPIKPKIEKEPDVSVINQGIEGFEQQTLAYVQDNLHNPSLYPALFLGGLLTNLTPCVYPMIPITLNIVSKWAKNNKKAPFSYCLGIVVTYSLLGLIAGLTGSLFGSLFQNAGFQIGIGVLFFLLALAMLGIGDLSFLTQLGYKVPLSHKFPLLGVFLMGSVSGLVAAPCMGPILGVILILIGQTHDPLYGLILMIPFSMGLALPYLFLGYLGQKVTKLPKIPYLIALSKWVFASFMFALSAYFLKSYLPRMIYAVPPWELIVACFTLWILGGIFFKKPYLGSVLHLSALIPLSLFLTLKVTYSYPKEVQITQKTSSKWLSRLEEAQKAALVEGKGLLIDSWADWCSACLEMDETVWNQEDLMNQIKEKYILLKIDFSDNDTQSQKVAKLLDIAGLPAVAIYHPHDVKNLDKPTFLFRSRITAQQLDEKLQEINQEKGNP